VSDKHIYFLRPVGSLGPVKIGCSKTPVKRLRGVEIWSPQLLEIAASAPGDHREEGILHQMFGPLRRHGEWFEYSERLGEVIAFVQRTGNLPPLDYSLDTYAAKRKNSNARSAMKRRGDPRVVTSKAVLTARIQSAERRVYTFWGLAVMRPAEVQEIVESYHGFDAPLPTETQMALVEEYIAMLGELPAADRSFGTWKEWHRAVPKARAA
jgi:hypothetical protein